MSAPNELRFSGAALINGNTIVAETGAEKRTILLDAKRRPLQARVGRQFLKVVSTILCNFFEYTLFESLISSVKTFYTSIFFL